MADTLQLEIVTPERLVVRDVVDGVQIPSKNGYLGILPGHAPLITELGVGVISYRKGGAATHLCVAWGFAEVLPDKVTILAETAEQASQINVERAQRTRREAEQTLATASAEQVKAAQDTLARAEAQIQTVASAGLADLANLVP